jgi:hypothetical protein
MLVSNQTQKSTALNISSLSMRCIARPCDVVKLRAQFGARERAEHEIPAAAAAIATTVCFLNMLELTWLTSCIAAAAAALAGVSVSS